MGIIRAGPNNYSVLSSWKPFFR